MTDAQPFLCFRHTCAAAESSNTIFVCLLCPAGCCACPSACCCVAGSGLEGAGAGWAAGVSTGAAAGCCSGAACCFSWGGPCCPCSWAPCCFCSCAHVHNRSTKSAFTPPCVSPAFFSSCFKSCSCKWWGMLAHAKSGCTMDSHHIWLP